VSYSRVAAAIVLAGMFASGGCAILPVSGPNAIDVKTGQKDPTSVNYGLVKVTPEAVRVLAEFEPQGIAGAFRDVRPPPEIKYGIGDVVSVTIFEAAAGGLFIPIEAGVRPGNFVTLPNQPVDTHGNISVPYAGAIRAAGRTPTQVQAEIVEKIKNRAIEPQAVVALQNQNTSLISVLGEVNQPNRFPAQPAGEHILDAITRAGGIKDHGYESWVVLERQGKRAAVPFGDLIYTPANNIWIWPGDTVYVYREPQTFLAFGAAGQQGQFKFDAWRITLAEAVAKAGGLLDLQADPESVFLYRRLPRAEAEHLGVDRAKFGQAQTVPVIFTMSFRDPAGYFLATKIQMQNKDVIFAANAQAVEITKFLAFIATIANTATAVTDVPINIQTLRIDSHL
jgi:polysaccharide export outer membrane protein